MYAPFSEGVCEGGTYCIAIKERRINICECDKKICMHVSECMSKTAMCFAILFTSDLILKLILFTSTTCQKYWK